MDKQCPLTGYGDPVFHRIPTWRQQGGFPYEDIEEDDKPNADDKKAVFHAMPGRRREDDNTKHRATLLASLSNLEKRKQDKNARLVFTPEANIKTRQKSR